MSNLYIEAAEGIKRAAKQHEVFVAAAEVLDRAGSFEQAAKEAQQARDAAVAQHELVLQNIEQAKKDLSGIIREGERLRLEASERIKREGEDVMAKVRIEADKALADAAQEAGQIKSAAVAEAAALKESSAKLRDEIDASTKERDSLSAQVEALEQQHQKLEKAISSLKAKFA